MRRALVREVPRCFDEERLGWMNTGKPSVSGAVELSVAPSLRQRHVDGDKLFANRNLYLDELPKGAVSAEVGVLKGDFSADIMQRTQPKLLHLIDIDLSRVCDRFAGLKRGGIPVFNDDIVSGFGLSLLRHRQSPPLRPEISDLAGSNKTRSPVASRSPRQER